MFEKTRLLATVAAAGLVWACGGGGDAGAGDGGAASDAGGETAAPVVDPATAGAISGIVAFEGEAPAGDRIDMAEEPECSDAYPGDGARTSSSGEWMLPMASRAAPNSWIASSSRCPSERASARASVASIRARWSL